MTKHFRHNGLFVSMICRASDYVAYRVENMQERREIRVYDDGRMTHGAGGFELAAADRAAVEAFRENDNREFQEWLSARPDLAEAYKKLST